MHTTCLVHLLSLVVPRKCNLMDGTTEKLTTRNSVGLIFDLREDQSKTVNLTSLGGRVFLQTLSDCNHVFNLNVIKCSMLDDEEQVRALH